MKTRLLIIIGIMIAVGSLFTIAYFTSVSYEIERCTSDTVYKDFTGEIVLRETCIFPFTGKKVTDTFLGCDEGFEEKNETCREIVPEPIPILDEGYEICLIENGTAKTVPESELQEHLAHGATLEDCRTLFPRPEISSDDVKSTQEHYAIEITGLKDVYLVGEQYDFSYIISGYGNSCGSKTVTFPDSNGDTIGSASSASCIANLPMGMFVFDIQKEHGTTYGHIKLKNPGTYTITVTFDRPSQHFPTTVSQEFRVTEE